MSKMAISVCKAWREKLSVFLVLGYFISNYSFKGIQYRLTAKEKCEEKTTGYEDCKHSHGFRTVLHWRGKGLNVARGINGRKN